MLKVAELCNFLVSPVVKSAVADGRMKIEPPAPDASIERIGARLGAGIVTELRSLLEMTAGFSVRSAKDPHDAAEFCLASAAEPAVWERVYPGGCEIAGTTGDNLLTWDIAAEPPGLVYFVCHDPPSHCLCFESLYECVEALVAAPEPSQLLGEFQSTSKRWPTVRDFQADREDLKKFLRDFPDHYWVHDMRGAKPGNGFPYFCDVDGISRFERKRLWVQVRPKGLREKLRWMNQRG